MNSNLKRYRQTSIFESFAAYKKPKTDNGSMEESSSIERKDKIIPIFFLPADEEKKIPSKPDICNSVNVCQTAEDSVAISENCENDAGKSVSNAKNQQYIEETIQCSDDLFPTQPSTEDFPVPSSSHSAELFHNISSSESESAPENNEYTPEENECTPEDIESIPESNECIPEDIECIPESNECIPESNECIPESNECIPESNECTPEDNECTPEDNECTPEDNECTPEDNECAPEDNESVSSSDESDDPMSILNRAPDCCLPLPKLEPSGNHVIMFSPHIRPGDAPRPYPSNYRDIWDENHVRFPCSPQSRYIVRNMLGEQRYVSRWELICRSLRSDIGSVIELENAIMKYNSYYIGKWNFEGLHFFINEVWNEVERDHFFETILPAMIEMALELPNICTRPMPLLKMGSDRSVTLSQKQIGCLLLNAFFCTFPRRTSPERRTKLRWGNEYSNYPDIHFNRLFMGESLPRSIEKLKCLFNYFRRIVFQEPTGTVTFHRQHVKIDKIPRWHSSTRGIRTAVIKSSGFIETDGQGMLQMDFANKYVGGGVLGRGLVQEEIRFLICPELIVSCLFVECLGKTEVLIIDGVEQYNKYSGYADSFQWEGDFKDETPRDSWGRRYTQLLAIDALCFRYSSHQYKFENLKRELNKAYSGFYEDAPPAHLRALATGNWGCGAFNGNPHLKFLIQLMAASEAGRNLVYFTFGDKKLKKELQKMYNFLNDKNLTIGDIWRLLVKYNNDTSNLTKNRPHLYDFIYSQFEIKEENSDDYQLLSDMDRKVLSKLFEDYPFDSPTKEIENGT